MLFFSNQPNRDARLGGLFYLAIIALGAFGEAYVRGSLIVSGDGAASLARIAEAKELWRLGIGGDLLMHLLDLPLIALFYLLLRPIHRGLALLSTLFNLVQSAVLAANKLTLIVPLLILNDNTLGPLAGGLARLAMSLHGYGFGIGLLFFGACCVLRGWLIYRCGFLPAALGVLIGIAGASYLLNSAALLLAPKLASALFPWVLLPALVGELALSLWLLLRGIDVVAWRRIAAEA